MLKKNLVPKFTLHFPSCQKSSLAEEVVSFLAGIFRSADAGTLDDKESIKQAMGYDNTYCIALMCVTNCPGKMPKDPVIIGAIIYHIYKHGCAVSWLACDGGHLGHLNLSINMSKISNTFNFAGLGLSWLFMQLVKDHTEAKNHSSGENLPIFLQVNDKETVRYVYSHLGFVKAGEDEVLETVVDHNVDDPPYHWNEDHDDIKF